MKDKVENLRTLGVTSPVKYEGADAALLEVFENLYPEREYVTEFVFNEFTSLCPKTRQPDFATIKVRYIADKYCIETKSLKTYYLSYRNEGMFMETIVNKILTDLEKIAEPRRIEVIGNFNARGGTVINVYATCKK